MADDQFEIELEDGQVKSFDPEVIADALAQPGAASNPAETAKTLREVLGIPDLSCAQAMAIVASFGEFTFAKLRGIRDQNQAPRRPQRRRR